MDPKSAVKYVAPPVTLDALRWLLRRNNGTITELEQFIRGGMVPWSSGYYAYKTQRIVAALSDNELIDIFRQNKTLPECYGIGIDERCIEYPWVIANLEREPETLLDAGSTFNYDFILNHPVLQKKRIHIMTLAPEGRCYWLKGVSYLYHDLRNIPIREDFYDTIACISTLEHIGLDNTFCTGSERFCEDNPQDFTFCMQEFRRVLKPGGKLLLTLPFGVYAHLGIQQQFDMNLLSRAVSAFGEASQLTVSFFRYVASGWNVATAADCADSDYVSWLSSAFANNLWPDPIPLEPDRAAAARAVACVKLVKPL